MWLNAGTDEAVADTGLDAPLTVIGVATRARNTQSETNRSREEKRRRADMWLKSSRGGHTSAFPESRDGRWPEMPRGAACAFVVTHPARERNACVSTEWANEVAIRARVKPAAAGPT